jgi:hypothetical protein
MRNAILTAALALLAASATGRADDPKDGWRTLPLVTNGKVDANWTHLGWGGFGVDGDTLRTDCDGRGMGLLLYKAEKFGNCQIRVVFKAKDAKSNSGVYVRIDDGILDAAKEKPLAVTRNPDGTLPKEELVKLMAESAAERRVWYPVHHGYEVQICDTGDAFHRTGAIYSLAKSVAAEKPATEWKTMVITLRGNVVDVDIDGKRVTTFDPDGKDVPAAKNWTEPKREAKRPLVGYIGLQNHDPGDVVFFKEVSVRPLQSGK